MKKDAWSEASLAATSELWGISEKEKEDLVELGQCVRDVDYYKNEPSEVLRFLRARPNDPKASEAMFRKMVSWRIQEDVDNALDNRPEQVIIDHLPGAILQGRDKDGDPIFVNRSGRMDLPGLIKQFGSQALVQYTIWIRELVINGAWREKPELERGRPFTRVLIIEDLKDFALTKFVRNPGLVSLYGELVRIDQENYPESAKKIIVIRTPALFRVVWNLVRGFFDPYIVEKLEFCGEKDVEKCLSKYLDLSVLPAAVLPNKGKGHSEVGMPVNFEGGKFDPKKTVGH